MLSFFHWLHNHYQSLSVQSFTVSVLFPLRCTIKMMCVNTNTALFGINLPKIRTYSKGKRLGYVLRTFLIYFACWRWRKSTEQFIKTALVVVTAEWRSVIRKKAEEEKKLTDWIHDDRYCSLYYFFVYIRLCGDAHYNTDDSVFSL